MDKNTEKLNAQKKLANIFFEMGMDEEVVSCVTGLNREDTLSIKKDVKTKKGKVDIDLKK
ncbi:MAG: hypothetical protein E7184_02335 [Erysipelotrichaceae bacterium]|nr:hypothetical protein [Erysipelotrichaceae bacterium]